MFASSHFNPGHPLPQTHINSFKCNSALTTSKTILLDKLLCDCLLTFHAILNTGELTHPFKKTLILQCISVQLQIPYIGYKNSFNEMEYALHIHNFNFKCNEISIKTSFRTLNSFSQKTEKHHNNGLCWLVRVPLAVSRQKSEHVMHIISFFFR